MWVVSLIFLWHTIRSCVLQVWAHQRWFDIRLNNKCQVGFQASYACTHSFNKTSGNQVRSDLRSDCWPWGHGAECFTRPFSVCIALSLGMRHTSLHIDRNTLCTVHMDQLCVCVWVCLHASRRIFFLTHTNTDTLPCGMLACRLAWLCSSGGVRLQ